MKKLAIAIIVAFAFCTAAVAQTATDPSQATQGSSPGMSQPSTPSQQQPGQQQPGYGQPDSTAGQAGQTKDTGAAPAEKAEKKLRGCIQSHGGQYVLEGKRGKAVALTGQDVSAHLGHEVSLKGAWESGGAGTGVSSGGASSEKSFNVTSVEMISETCGGKSSKGNSGSMGGSPSSSSPSSSSPPATGSTNPPQ